MSEVEKMKQVQGEAQVIGEFLEWLQEENVYDPDGRSIEELLADYFSIDLKKVEQEKRQIIANVTTKC